MTSEQRKQWFLGRDYWYQYVSLNGYAFSPSKTGLSNLAKRTGEKQADLQKAINYFLEN